MFYSNGILDVELRDELLKIRGEVIEKCSEIIHHDYEATNGPNIRDPFKIRNFIHFPVHGNNKSDGKIYRFVYEEYRFPYLVKLIDKLLRNDIRVIDELEDIDMSKEIIPFVDKIEAVSKELDSIPNINIREKRIKLNELEYLLIQSEYNKRQVSVIPYYQIVLELLNKYKVKSNSMMLVCK